MCEGLLEFQQSCFLIFQACWSSSRAVFCFFALAGVPAELFFDFSGLLEFLQSCFLIFQACWSSSSLIFFIFSLAGTPAGLKRHHVFRTLSFSKYQTAPVPILSLFGLCQPQGLCFFCEQGHIFGVKTTQNEHTFRLHESCEGWQIA